MHFGTHLAFLPLEAVLPFTPTAIEAALREFRNHATDLGTATQQTWTDRVEALIHTCRSTAVLQAVLAPLWAHSSDPVAFWNARVARWGASAGRDPIRLGSDPTARAALVLKFMGLVVDDNLKFSTVLVQLFGPDNDFPWRISQFYQVMVTPLAREVEGRLLQQYQEVSGRPLGSLPTTLVMGTGNIVGNQGTVQGNVAASGRARVDASHVSYTATSDAGKLFQSWIAHLEEVEQHRHEEVRLALTELARAADTRAGDPVALARAAQTVVTASPGFVERVRKFIADFSRETAVQTSATLATRQILEAAPAVLYALQLALAAIR